MRGQTPLTIEGVSLGRHKLVLRKPGFVEEESEDEAACGILSETNLIDLGCDQSGQSPSLPLYLVLVLILSRFSRHEMLRLRSPTK